jgi:hypothetical protein
MPKTNSTDDTRLAVPQAEVADLLDISLWDLQVACQRGDVPTIRCGNAIEIPMTWIEAVAEGRRSLPPYFDPAWQPGEDKAALPVEEAK